MPIDFPKNFPTIEEMLSIMQKTIEKSWKIEMDTDDINLWLSNFTGKCYDKEDERRIALWLLCNYTYYNSDDVNHLCKILHRKFVHELITKQDLTGSTQIKELLKSVCFSAIGSASESGGLLLYHYRQEADISIDRFFYPSSVEALSENILVFIDDVTISGGTAVRFFYKNLKHIKNKNIYYLAIISSEDAVKKLTDLGINVVSCYLFDERNKCFSDSSMIFHKFPEIREAAKNISETYGDMIAEKAYRLGYKNSECCFGFYYNTPNNTLPIFWSTDNWTPIFPRKEKLQNAREIPYETRRYI